MQQEQQSVIRPPNLPKGMPPLPVPGVGVAQLPKGMPPIPIVAKLQTKDEEGGEKLQQTIISGKPDGVKNANNGASSSMRGE